MRIHLRFGKKDPDLCKWRNSIDRRLATFYINCILTAEVQGKIAYVPHAAVLSADATPCEICVFTCSDEVDRYIKTLVPNKINATVKKIIRRHLAEQRWNRSISADPFSGEVVLIPSYSRTGSDTQEPMKRENTEFTVRTEKNDTEQAHFAINETEEEQALRLALLAMSDG